MAPCAAAAAGGLTAQWSGHRSRRSRLRYAAPLGFAFATPAWLRLKSGCRSSRAPFGSVQHTVAHRWASPHESAEFPTRVKGVVAMFDPTVPHSFIRYPRVPEW